MSPKRTVVLVTSSLAVNGIPSHQKLIAYPERSIYMVQPVNLRSNAHHDVAEVMVAVHSFAAPDRNLRNPVVARSEATKRSRRLDLDCTRLPRPDLRDTQ